MLSLKEIYFIEIFRRITEVWDYHWVMTWTIVAAAPVSYLVSLIILSKVAYDYFTCFLGLVATRENVGAVLFLPVGYSLTVNLPFPPLWLMDDFVI